MSEAFGRFVMYACCAALAAVALGYALLLAGRAAAWLRDRWLRSPRERFAALALAACAAVMYGGSKSTFTFYGVNPLRGSSYTTNDTVHVEWLYNPDLVGIENDSVFIAYRPNESTNSADWVRHDQTWPVYARVAEFTLADATNYSFYVWTEYIPPSPVVTNGVYHVSGFLKPEGDDGKIVPVKVRLTVIDDDGNETVIAPINERNAE